MFIHFLTPSVYVHLYVIAYLLTTSSFDTPQSLFKTLDTYLQITYIPHRFLSAT